MYEIIRDYGCMRDLVARDARLFGLYFYEIHFGKLREKMVM